MEVRVLSYARKAVIPLLSIWLIAWIYLSWYAVQDDALIHLRYANFLHSLHFITFDGVRSNYGESSLLYVGILALLRSVTVSPLLPHAVSSFFHLVLFAMCSVTFLRAERCSSSRVHFLLLALVVVLVAPSAIRWLDDGMETGLVLSMIAVLVWQVHRLSLRTRVTALNYCFSVLLGFLLVLLRIELASAALFASLILVLARKNEPGWRNLSLWISCLHFVLGAIVAACAIRLLMHSFVPDTALAKSHGYGGLITPLRDAATVLSGALLFGLGTMSLWLVSAIMVLRDGCLRMASIAANALFPVVLGVAVLRGQEIQGARHLVWCFFFSICWNIFELWHSARSLHTPSFSTASAILLVICISVMPLESHVMYRVLRTRSNTMKTFMSENLQLPLQGSLGVARDVGYISYFTQDKICDLAGLVNGRIAASMNDDQRLEACARLRPSFAFVNADQAYVIAQVIDVSEWKVCGKYDFGNLRIPDRHFLLVSPELVAATCLATRFTPSPASTSMIESSY